MSRVESIITNDVWSATWIKSHLRKEHVGETFFQFFFSNSDEVLRLRRAIRKACLKYYIKETPPKTNPLKLPLTSTYPSWECPTPQHHSHVLVLDHPLRTLKTFACGIQIPHSLMRHTWNSISLLIQRTHTHSGTWSDNGCIAPSTLEQLFSWQAALGYEVFCTSRQQQRAAWRGKRTHVFFFSPCPTVPWALE